MDDADFEDDERCLDHLHRHKTICLLQEVLREVGLESFQAVFDHFETIKNAGYTVEEVVETDTENLIDRSDYVQRLEEEEGESDEDDMDEYENGDDSPSDDEEGSFEQVPDEMTDAVLQEERQLRDAIAASQREQLEKEEEERGKHGDDDEEEEERQHKNDNDEDEEFEQVPDEMPAAVVQEESNLRRALRAVLENSTHET